MNNSRSDQPMKRGWAFSQLNHFVGMSLYVSMWGKDSLSNKDLTERRFTVHRMPAICFILDHRDGRFVSYARPDICS